MQKCLTHPAVTMTPTMAIPMNKGMVRELRKTAGFGATSSWMADGHRLPVTSRRCVFIPLGVHVTNVTKSSSSRGSNASVCSGKTTLLSLLTIPLMLSFLG
jgi:hypothetical protein